MKGGLDLTNSKHFSWKSAVILKTSSRGTLASVQLYEALLEAVQEGAELLLQQQASVRAVIAGGIKGNQVFQWRAIAGNASRIWQKKCK